MATESKVHSDSTVAAALASSSDHPNAQALECDDEVGSTAVIDALKVVAILFTIAVCSMHAHANLLRIMACDCLNFTLETSFMSDRAIVC